MDASRHVQSTTNIPGLSSRTAIGDNTNTILVSTASAWEITTKARLGKLPGATEVAADVAGVPGQPGLFLARHHVLHAQRAGRLPGDHRDPFDRMLIAQAQLEDVPIVSDDGVFDGYGVTHLW